VVLSEIVAGLSTIHAAHHGALVRRGRAGRWEIRPARPARHSAGRDAASRGNRARCDNGSSVNHPDAGVVRSVGCLASASGRDPVRRAMDCCASRRQDGLHIVNVGGAVADELLYMVDGAKAVAAQRISLADAGLLERQHLQQWVVEHPELIGDGCQGCRVRVRTSRPVTRAPATASVEVR
jgi:hypothetical protein